MSRLNEVKRTTTKTVNLAGGVAYKESDKLMFISLLLTSFLKDKFYESTNEQANRIVDLTLKVHPLFAAKAAIYARNEFGMRTVTHLVAGEIASEVKGESWTKNFFDKIIHRPDDMTEIMAYYLKRFGKPIPNSLKKGFALAFNKFDSYSLAKYRGEGNEIKLVDIVNLVHPVANKKNEVALKELIKGKLKSTGTNKTWESALTQAGQEAKDEEEKAELKKDAWSDLIKNKKIKHFALLRNLRNILTQAPEVLDEALELLCNETEIKKALVLPFRYSTALKQFENTTDSNARKVIRALNKALDISCSNVPKFVGKTVVVLDVSGSMQGFPLDIGSLFSAILVKTNDCDFVTFASTARYVNLHTDDSILTLQKNIVHGFGGGGTNFNSIFTVLNKVYDRIIILSDMQGWQAERNSYSNQGGAPTASFAKYKTKYNCNPKVFSFDLNGLGSLMFPENNVYCLAGWSDRVFDIMRLLEEDKKALINKIESIEL